MGPNFSTVSPGRSTYVTWEPTEFSSGVRAERYVPVSRLSDSVDSDDSIPDVESARGAVPRERWRVLPAQVPLDEQTTSEPASHAPDPEAGRNPDNDWLLRGI